MKKTFKSIMSILLVMLLAFSCCSVAFAEDIGVFPGEIGPSARPEAQPPTVDENGVVYDAEGNRFGFNFIKAGDVEYRDIFNGLGTMDGMSVREFYKQAVSSKFVSKESAPTGSRSLLEFWGNVAAKVFKLAGRGIGWQYDYDSDFDEYFGPGADDKSNCAVDVAAHLSSTEPYSKGGLEWDCVRGTGLEAYSSLNMVQDVMLEQIVDVCGERNDAEEFKKVVLEFCVDDEEGFELFKNTDEQVVLSNIITSQYNFVGSTVRLFSTFGIVFYDFKLTPVIDENLQYISAADNYESIKDAFENNAPGVTSTESDGGTTSISYIKNPTNEPASVSASSSKSTTNSVSNSFSESENYSFSESISANVGIKISDALNVGVNFGFSASQAFGTSYSEDKSLSETVSTSSSASVTLPAYTELGIKQTMSMVEQTVEYDCPVYITYKVAVFGVNGQYLQDSGTGSWSIANYDQGSIFTNFGSDSQIGGVNAIDNLYNRLDEKSYAFELSYGDTYGMWEDQDDGNLPLKINHIDWNNLSAVEEKTLDSEMERFKKYIPMSSMGGKMTFKTESYNTEITDIYPIYDLKRVRFEGDGTHNMAIGGDLDLNTISVIGLNQLDRPYYGFNGRMGTWYICDKDGNDITYEEGKGISLEATPSSQIVNAHEIGEYYVRFEIDEHYYTKAADRKTYITNDDLEMTAILKVSVTDTGNDHDCRAGSWVTTITPYCNTAGERCKYCLTCSKRMAVEVIPKVGHVPVEIVVPATCTADGSKTTTCAVCRATCGYEVIPAKGHGNTYSVTTVAPTCSSVGEKVIYCYDCNKAVGSEEIECTSHNSGAWNVDFEPAEGRDGQMTRYCINCGMPLESKAIVNNSGNNDTDNTACSHICHNTGISGFFWNIIRIFWKIFRMNPVCECGAAHY